VGAVLLKQDRRCGNAVERYQAQEGFIGPKHEIARTSLNVSTVARSLSTGHSPGIRERRRHAMFGWMGTILRVDLTSGKDREGVAGAMNLRYNYVGGRGINDRILLQGGGKREPTASTLIICFVFGTGPLTGQWWRLTRKHAPPCHP